MSYTERLWLPKVRDRSKVTPYWGEHAARYVYAQSYVQGKRVLDVACGTGYGCHILSQVASSVIGVDADEDAIRKATEEYPEGNFIVSNAEEMPFSDASFDVVVSFETIEHLSNRRQFLSEIHRLLSKNGLLILSTPNAFYTKPINGIPRNPFHVHEYTPDELRQELGNFFKIETMLGQTLSPEFIIPPFWDAQQRLPKDIITQTRLLFWKIINKMPISIRESLSQLIWKRPFYPKEYDYEFREDTIQEAPTIAVICRKMA